MKNLIQIHRKPLVALLLGIALVGCRGGKTEVGPALERAGTEQAAGDFEAAEIGYKNVLKKAPRNAAAMGGLGTIWLERGVPLEAVRLLGTARSLAPQDAEIHAEFARALLAMGYFGQAREEALKVVRDHPRQEEALLVVVDTSFTPEQMEESEAVLEGLPEPERPRVQLAAAFLQARRGEREEALDTVGAVVQSAPDLALAHALKARLHQVAGEEEAAMVSSKRAVDLAPTRSPIRIQHAMLLIAAEQEEAAAGFLTKTTQEVPDFLPAWRLRAQLALKAGDREKAGEMLAKVFERSPSDLDAGLMQNDLWLVEGEGEKAVELMKTIRETYPPQPTIEFGLARAHLLEGNRTLAKEALDRTLEMDPYHADALVVRARLHFAEGEVKQVIQPMEELLQRQPDHGAAQVLLAEAYRTSGRAADASAILGPRAEATPDNFLPHLQYGMALRGEGKPEEARAAFERARELAPDHLLVVSQLVALDASEKKFREAHGRVDQHLIDSPESAGAYLLRAMIFEQEEKWPEAEEAALAAISREPKLLSAYALLIRVHTATGQAEKLLADLENLVAQAPHDPVALMRLGSLQQGAGRLADARETYERLLKTTPDFAPALNNLAMIYAEQPAELAQAFTLANRARTLLPDDPAVADTLGWILFRQRDYARALPLLEQAAARLPADAKVQYHLGMASMMMNRRADAEAAFERSLAADPEQAEVKARLAQLRATPTPEQLRELLDRSPDDIVSRIRLGEVLTEQDEHAAAAEQYAAALKTNPRLGDVWMKLAALYSGPLGEPDKALDAARTAREIAPTDPAVAALIGRIVFAAGDHAWAYSLLRESMSSNSSPQLLLDAGLAAYSLGRVSEARELMAQSKKASQEDAETHEVDQFLAWTSNDPPAEAEALLAVKPDYVPALVVQAAQHEAAGNFAEAAEIYEDILTIYPRFAPAKSSLARVTLEQSGDLEKAKELVMEARETMRDDPQVISLLAKISYLEKDFDYAIQLMRQVESSAKEMSAGEMYIFGMSLFEQKQNERARALLEQALAAGVREPDAASARAALAEMQ